MKSDNKKELQHKIPNDSHPDLQINDKHTKLPDVWTDRETDNAILQ